VNETNQVHHNDIAAPRASNGVVSKILLGGALAAALGGWWYQSTQVSSVRHELADTQQKMDQLRGQMDTSVAMAKAEVNDSVSKMNEQVAKAQQETQASAARAAMLARQQTAGVMKTLGAKNDELVSQIDQFKKETADQSSKVDETITGIKGDVGSVKGELDQTVADLKRTNGDMGVMSGLIATNAGELQALRQMGERDYIEFTLTRKDQPQQVGTVQLTLKKADVKRNRFTLDVMADDRRVEKRDKNVNEPIQFYTSHARIPYEVVVNQISKDKVTGYLSVPKVKIMAQR